MGNNGKTRPPYTVYCDDEVIGTTDFAAADPSMGARMGELATADGYRRIAPLVRELSRVEVELSGIERDSDEGRQLAARQEQLWEAYRQLRFQVVDVNEIELGTINLEISDYYDVWPANERAKRKPEITLLTFDGELYDRFFD